MTENKTEPLPIPEQLPRVESLERVIAITSIKIGNKQGFRVIWPSNRPTQAQTYTDFYILKENGMYTLVSQMISVSPQHVIKDLYKQDEADNPRLMGLAHKCAREKAEELARQLQDRVEDYSGYTNGGKKS